MISAHTAKLMIGKYFVWVSELDPKIYYLILDVDIEKNRIFTFRSNIYSYRFDHSLSCDGCRWKPKCKTSNWKINNHRYCSDLDEFLTNIIYKRLVESPLKGILYCGTDGMRKEE